MAEYFKLPCFNQQNYVEIKLPRSEGSAGTNHANDGNGTEIICCVDTSGSMAGSPINNVCEVLRDIYQRTQKDYRLFTYNTQTDTKRTLKTLFEQNTNLQASGGTAFACIFTSIKDYLLQNSSSKKATTFIFMTDGQDNEPNSQALKKSIEMLKLILSGMTNSPPITFHVIGFGEVNDQFLNQIRTFGTRQGLFRYSTESKELQNNFNDMFEYALNVREFIIKFSNGKTYTANSIDNETVGFLTNDDDDLTSVTELTLTDDTKTTTNLPLTQMTNIRAIHLLRALNLISPQNEEHVKSIQTYLNTIQVTHSKNIMERLEAEQIHQEIDQRMMEYRQIFTQLKMNQVPERVKLQLSALRHDAVFANTQRKKKLDLRVNKNADYFKKTDISGILQGYKDSITPGTWQMIKEQKQEWVDVYSNEDIYEIMRKSPDNILCLGNHCTRKNLFSILVQRSEEAVTNPTKGLKLLNVTNTIISYDSFINAMNVAKNDLQQTQGEFTILNDLYCVAGALSNERINAVIPLYINDEHMKRIRILEGIWLGYLYTLDSYGYDKQQEVAILKLLCEIIQQRTDTQRQKQILFELEKVCKFIIYESQGFKTAEQYGEKTYEKLLNRFVLVNSQEYDLRIPLMIGYLKDNVTSVLLPVYYEYLRQQYQNKYNKRSLETKQIVENLVYGCEAKHQTMTVSTNNRDNITTINSDPDYIEKSYIDYYHDELCEPIQLLKEKINNENQRLIVSDAIEVDYIKSLLLPIPDFINNLLNYCPKIDKDYIDKHLDYAHLRWELLVTFYYLIYSDTNSGALQNLPKEENILSVIDQRLQSGKEHVVDYDYSTENIRLVSYVALNCKTLEGFAGLMRKYCSQCRGPLFTEIFKQLLPPSDDNENDSIAGKITKKDKLIALITNQIPTTTTIKPFYNTKNYQRQSYYDGRMDSLYEFINNNEVTEIQLHHLEKIVVYCRGRSTLPDRKSRKQRLHCYVLF
ncbi:unnamed protein product [Adineta steineri]|uniref:VWFA domain-containing protein n=1 Tax=Adineta steineri TaxID=433720 RepID=A0A814MWJ0_9BILA|nr:unnamed protein product [Adineta steineri]